MSAKIPDVIELEPQFKPRVWGGRRLAEWFGLATDEPIGEAWMVAGENRIASGPYAGRVLAEVLPELGEAFLGRAVVERHGYRLPLMVKFLDTAQWLSVQVHPDDAYARAHEAESGWLGKAEAWVVLEAEPGAQVIYGVKRPVTRAELRAAALDGSILELLNFVPVQKGDVIYVPPGTIHALGPGLLVYEVSQRSDLTYRLYDYGRGRELHLEKALDVARLEPMEAPHRKLSPGKLLDESEFELVAVLGTFRGPKSACFLEQVLELPARGRVLAAGKASGAVQSLRLCAFPKCTNHVPVS
ncbi:mannose-6-phosphate isomerase, type 1 [Oceanithermus profundus DSM 14977]|uniref:Mannose-6-phosphate isomerase, type 1 n=1 Tax=Oceanithermus profundus (strain DSM 14977 / NBRC 100410 / VKM B-2274 / 506) TaxID=670487 RepID=E4U5E5_OCEP5|nr:type I phosphomannose isomerase catalytic subunit [Oceanithermus profundus]ADR37619.1 mannose-6-phosphate isomerase, type 1 [Oceanithermus profundus DSM 14977]